MTVMLTEIVNTEKGGLSYYDRRDHELQANGAGWEIIVSSKCRGGQNSNMDF